MRGWPSLDSIGLTVSIPEPCKEVPCKACVHFPAAQGEVISYWSVMELIRVEPQKWISALTE